MILSSYMLKGKNCDITSEKQLKKNKFNSWINIKSEEYSNDSTEKCSCIKKETTKIEFHSPVSVENHCDYKLEKTRKAMLRRYWNHPLITTVKSILCKVYMKKKIY